MELTDIKGVGPKMLENLHELNIYSVEDLLTFYPYRYDIFEPINLTKDYIYFRNNDIEKIVFLGFSNDKSEFYREYLSNIKNNFNPNEDLSSDVIKKILKDSLPNMNNIKSEV